MPLMRVDDLRSTQLVLHCLWIQPHLNAVFVDKDTHHRIVELSLELNLVGKYSERLVGATFASERVTCPEIVAAELSVLPAWDNIMLLSALTSLVQEQRTQPLVLVLRPQPLSTLKLHPTILQQLAPCGPL